MRIAVIGAGAVGCFLAARLSDHGHEVTLVGRPAQVDAINATGLLLRDQRGEEKRYPLSATTTLTTQPELTLLTVKTQDLAEACREIRSCVADTPVISLQNGLQGDSIAGEILGREHILGGVVMCATSYLKPGEIEVQFSGWMILGEPFHPTGRRLHEIAAILRDALPTFTTHNLSRARWTKLISNLNNGICAATGLALPDLARTSLGRILSVRIMKEGYHVARAAGVHLDHGFYGLSPRMLRQDANAPLIALAQSVMTSVLALAPEGAATAVLSTAGRSRLNQLPLRFSTWQSIARGKPSEIDYLNGEIVRRGQMFDVPTPYNTRLVEFVHRVEKTGKFCELVDLLPSQDSQPDATTVTQKLKER